MARGDGYTSASYTRPNEDHTYVHFAHDQKPVKGDLVVAITTFAANRWSIGWFESSEGDNYVIREIGTGVLCNYSNESFVPIRGMRYTDLLEGDQRQFYLKVLKAFSKGGDWSHAFGGIRFADETVTVTVRARYNISPSFEVVIPYQKKMGVTKILNLLREGGYGKHKDSEKA